MDKVQQQLSKMNDKDLFETFDVYRYGQDQNGQEQISFKGNVGGEDVEVFVDIDYSTLAECAKERGILIDDPKDLEDEEGKAMCEYYLWDFCSDHDETVEWDLLWKQLPEIIKNGKYEILYDECESL